MNPQWKLGSTLHTFGPTANPAKGPWYDSGYVGVGGRRVVVCPDGPQVFISSCITYRSHIPECLKHPLLPPPPPLLRLETA